MKSSPLKPLLLFATLALALSACAKKSPSNNASDSAKKDAQIDPCTKIPETLPSGLGETAPARVFDLSPAISANDPNLLPTNPGIDALASSVQLNHLSGDGLLDGKYLGVLSGLCVQPDKSIVPGAFSAKNDFTFRHDDPRFAEAMAYYYGDLYRTETANASSLQPTSQVLVIANCHFASGKDNAYYSRNANDDGTFTDYVCLGYSSRLASQHATFADDGEVVIHELQHAQTTYSYSPTYGLNQLNYDEAGTMNEGISDAIALMNSVDRIKPPFDPKRFAAWSLGTFFGTSGDGSRGAHRCPTYDPTYPTCSGFKTGAAGFSADARTISFSYPDGLGWPYAGFYSGTNALSRAFTESLSFQEIHQASIIVSGAIYEVFESVVASRGDTVSARNFVTKVLSRALLLLEKPSATDPSPTTMPALFTQIVAAAQHLGASDAELAAIKQIGRERGLYDVAMLGANWASYLTSRFTEVNGSTTFDHKLTIGDLGYISFNIQNADALTAGGVTVDFVITDTDPLIQVITTVKDEAMPGVISDHEAVAMYQKINGTGIVAALTSADTAKNVPTSNNYFGSFTSQLDGDGNSALDSTGIAIRVVKKKANGDPATAGTVHAELRVKAANAPLVTLPITLQVLDK